MNDRYDVWELYPGLIAGTLWNYRELIRLKPDVFVVLDRLPERIWDDGFSGEILYYPIRAYDVLPAGILDRMTTEITDRVRGGKRVAIFSREDRGRLCYAAALALFCLGLREPVGYLRKNYSAQALGQGLQLAQIDELCHRRADGTGRRCAQKSEHIQIDDIEAFQQDEDIIRELQRIGGALGEDVRIMLRFSGQLPSVRVMAEAATDLVCEISINALIEVVKEKGHLVNYITD